ncbi:MAG: bifunctional folylpolyglutamate synthase/dihydrofolate synthase [Chitinophagales bacterium]
MTYSECIEWLYGQLPMYQNVGKEAVKKDLTNISLLCKGLGNPHKKSTFIHIAGTNGKGSVSHILSSIYQAAGFKTGLYTSPHYLDFRERIRVDGLMISEENVVWFVEEHKELILKVSPSFFEITVAMAFDYFAKQQVDLAIIETGLGGRLDSTNIIHPMLSIITRIGLDHMNMLGPDLASISKEKAGIIKHNTPVLIGVDQKETKNVFSQVAKKQHAKVYYADRLNTLQGEHSRITLEKGHDLECIQGQFHIQGKEYAYQSDLVGTYQKENIRTAFQALSMLPLAYRPSPEAIGKGLGQVGPSTGYMGRMQVIQREPLILLDAGHNADGIQALLDSLPNYGGRLHVLFGASADKDIQSVLSLFPSNTCFTWTQAKVVRAMNAEKLKNEALRLGYTGNAYHSSQEGFTAVKTMLTSKDILIVCGSVFLVAEVLASAT